MRPNIFETNTKTFFRLKSFEPIMSLFFETKFVEANTDALKKNEKSLDTEKSRDEMSHSARRRKICMFDPPNDVTQ